AKTLAGAFLVRFGSASEARGSVSQGPPRCRSLHHGVPSETLAGPTVCRGNRRGSPLPGRLGLLSFLHAERSTDPGVDSCRDCFHWTAGRETRRLLPAPCPLPHAR